VSIRGTILINKTRRNALKFLGVPVAGLFVSDLSANEAALLEPEVSSTDDQASRNSDITGIVCRFEKSRLSGVAEVVIENTSTDAITVSHVYPGIVHANGFNYDLNTILEHAPLTLSAGGALRSPIHPQRSGEDEMSIPTGLTYSSPVTVATQVANAAGSDSDVRTLRSYFS